MANYTQERAYFRIQYPDSARPVFRGRQAGEVFQVVDCSEQGLRFRAAQLAELPEVGAESMGIVQFRSGERAEVAGTVVRVQDGDVALHLTGAGIPRRVVLEEQRYLRSHFPDWVANARRQRGEITPVLPEAVIEVPTRAAPAPRKRRVWDSLPSRLLASLNLL